MNGQIKLLTEWSNWPYCRAGLNKAVKHGAINPTYDWKKRELP